MRFHVLGLPWTVTSKDYCDCAYTSKVLKFCKMMAGRGHFVTHYGAEGAEVACDHVSVISENEQLKLRGPRDKQNPWNPSWDPNDPLWMLYNARCAAGLAANIENGDFVCHITGASRPIVRFLNEFPAIHVEYGVGYTGVFCDYRAFESHSVRDALWYHQNFQPNGRALDYVIPNYFDIEDFPAGPGGDYLLFVGRIIQRKGLATAFEVAEKAGMKLIVAGQGAKAIDKGLLSTEVVNGLPVTYRTGGQLEYVGHVDVKRRAELMGGARAILCPTYYLEPFGGVNVEAQLCGTPAITYDWGGFVETVEHGKSGYRCMYPLDDWAMAVKSAGNLDRRYIRERAISKYSLERVGLMFDDWFQAVEAAHARKTSTGKERKVETWLRSC